MSQCHDIYEAVDDRHIEVQDEVVTQCHDLYVVPTFAPFDTTAPPVTPGQEARDPLMDKPAPSRNPDTAPRT